MNYRFLLIVFLSAFYLNGQAQIYLEHNTFDFGKIINPDLLTIPQPASLVEKDVLAKTLNLKPETISSKDAKSSAGVKNIKSTFYNIQNNDVAYAGVLFQISVNPVYIEAPTYISSSLDNKMEHGEVLSSLNKKVLYKEDFAGKIRFVYNKDIGQIYWNIGDNYLMMLGFNGLLENDEDLVKTAKVLIPHITKNFLAKLLE
ncbi:MAG: hypothetical protein LC107_02535 [Chitinophagales bacterium]|nr:hypothetical protein [Chitinophagales bacterium]